MSGKPNKTLLGRCSTCGKTRSTSHNTCEECKARAKESIDKYMKMKRPQATGDKNVKKVVVPKYFSTS